MSIPQSAIKSHNYIKTSVNILFHERPVFILNYHARGKTIVSLFTAFICSVYYCFQCIFLINLKKMYMRTPHRSRKNNNDHSTGILITSDTAM